MNRARQPTTARDEYFSRMFGQVFEVVPGRPLALQGANFWAWGGEGRVGAGESVSPRHSQATSSASLRA